jgi:MoaA/NifB/PqqE/SkfB family radical SAM enzyme
MKSSNSLVSHMTSVKQFQAAWQYLTGNYRACEFALTNICVSQCSFCNIWKQQPKIMVNTQKALITIDKLADLGVRFITITGGEPLIHPDVADLVAKCTERGIATAVLNADPRLITGERIGKLKKAGLDFLCISVDHYNDEVEYESRKIANLLGHISTALPNVKYAGIKTIASVLISNFNHNELGKLFDKCVGLGFDSISINYPEHSLSHVYELGGQMVQLTPEEIITALEEVIRLKRKGYPVINAVPSMNNIIKYLHNEKLDFLCRGGNRVLFVDWFFNVYPCMHLADKLGTVFGLDKQKLLKKQCNDCGMSWYRDFSIYFEGAKSLKAFIGSI